MYSGDENPFEQLRRQNAADCTVALIIVMVGALLIWLVVPDRLDTGVAFITMVASLITASGTWRR